MHLNGLKVFVSPLVKSQVQVKKHKRNKRISKKWLKLYGTKTVESIIKTPYGIFVGPETFDKLKKTLGT